MKNTPYNPPLFGISPNPAVKNIQLTHYYHDLRMDTFIFWPIGNEETQTPLFAEEIVPTLRSALAHRRNITHPWNNRIPQDACGRPIRGVQTIVPRRFGDACALIPTHALRSR